ncbi:hypothetical protein HY632_03440 [Candidatus Uhrbacteria bacterium]|nr:hypothetical protein [Candidatus Uhrbacteria bacterium]
MKERVTSAWFPSGSAFQGVITAPHSLRSICEVQADGVMDFIAKGALAVVVRCDVFHRTWSIECDRELEPFHMFTGFDPDTDLAEFMQARAYSIPEDWHPPQFRSDLTALRMKPPHWESGVLRRHEYAAGECGSFGDFIDWFVCELGWSLLHGATEVLLEFYPQERMAQVADNGRMRPVWDLRSPVPPALDQFFRQDLAEFYRARGVPPFASA